MIPLIPNEAIEIFVVFDQPVEDKRVDVARGGILCKNGVEIRGISDRTHDEFVDIRRTHGASEDDADY